MSKDEIAYRIRLMFYSIFAVIFSFLFIAVSSYLKLQENSSYKQTEQIKSNVVEGLKVREKILFEEFSTRSYVSIRQRIDSFLQSQKIYNSQIQFIQGSNCVDYASKPCDVLNKMNISKISSIQDMVLLGDVFIVIPMQGWGEKIGYIVVTFPHAEISSSPSLNEKIAFYILPFVLLGILTYTVFTIAESRIVRPTIKRIIETEKIKAQQSIIRQFAHDIKSPLVALETAVDCNTEDPSTKVLLNDALERIKAISSDLLDWDRSFIRVDEVDLHKMITNIVEEKRAYYKDVVFESEIDVHNSLRSVLINPIDLYRVLSNLLNNSIEASGDYCFLKISAQNVNNNMKISISDNGPGVLPEKVNLILKGEFSSKANGNGLGVSSAKAWVEKMNGVFNMESQLGLGTTVSINLPLSNS